MKNEIAIANICQFFSVCDPLNTDLRLTQYHHRPVVNHHYHDRWSHLRGTKTVGRFGNVSFVSVPSRVHGPQPGEDEGGRDARHDHRDGEDEADDVDVPLAVVGA